MMNSTSLRFLSGKVLFFFLAVAALALAPEVVFAQHGGGGHAAGGGGGHFSPPPAPRAPAPSAPRPVTLPATHFASPVVAMPPHIPVYHQASNSTPPVNGQLPATGLQGAPVGNVVANLPVQSNSPGTSLLPGHTIAGSSRSFFGDGHEIWTEPKRAVIAPTTNGSSAIGTRTFSRPAGFASTTAAPPSPAGGVNFSRGRFGGPIFIGPGFGFGYGAPFFGYPFGFGDSFFFGNPFFGFQYGSVWVPCNGFGPGLQCAPFNYNYGYDPNYDSSYNSVISGGPEPDTETQSQQIYSPYSPALQPADENTSAGSSNEYMLYLKDGAVYMVSDYWFADGKLVYSTSNGQESVDMDRIDMQKTLDVNAKRGLVFTLRPEPPAAPQNDQNAPAQPNQGAAPAQSAPNSAPTPTTQP